MSADHDQQSLRSPIPGQGQPNRPGRQPAARPAHAEHPARPAGAEHTARPAGAEHTARPAGAEHIPPADAGDPVGYADVRDFSAAGWERLHAGFYPAAVRYFDEYLNRAQVGDGVAGDADRRRRARVHLGAAVARLAGAPPGHRSADEIAEIANHLLAARATDLAPVLAALLCEDHYEPAGLDSPAALAQVAERAVVERLARPDVALLAGHVAPVRGDTWARVFRHASRVGPAVRPYRSAEDHPAQDDERRTGVRRYFTATPRPPRRQRAGTAPTLFLAGLACILLAGVVFVVGDGPAVVLGIGGACLAVACGLLAGGVSAYRGYRAYRREYHRFRRSWAEAEPKPADARLDGWLREDVDRIVTLGAQRHRLNPRRTERGGDLLVEPQVLVGFSRRSFTRLRNRTVPDPAQPSGYAVVQQQTIVPVARARAGADGRLRSDNHHVLAVYLARDRLCVLECELELATRHVVTETARSFHYDDVVGIVAGDGGSGRRADPVRVLLDTGSGGYGPVVADDRVTLSVLDGESLTLDIGVSGRLADGSPRPLTWDNRQALETIERVVRSRRRAAPR